MRVRLAVGDDVGEGEGSGVVEGVGAGAGAGLGGGGGGAGVLGGFQLFHAGAEFEKAGMGGAPKNGSFAGDEVPLLRRGVMLVGHGWGEVMGN